MEVKYQQGLGHLEYAVQLYWEPISRGRFFIHEHPATASSWGLAMIKELERHPGVQVVTGDMCRWGMTLEKDISTDEPIRLIKKPTKWMTNSPILAKLLQARCNGQHEHERLEGSSRTKQAESYPIPLVKAILNNIHQTKRMKMDANMAKDPLHTQRCSGSAKTTSRFLGQCFGNPNPYNLSKKYGSTPPICTAVRPPFVSPYFPGF